MERGRREGGQQTPTTRDKNSIGLNGFRPKKKQLNRAYLGRWPVSQDFSFCTVLLWFLLNMLFCFGPDSNKITFNGFSPKSTQIDARKKSTKIDPPTILKLCDFAPLAYPRAFFSQSLCPEPDCVPVHSHEIKTVSEYFFTRHV